VTLRPHRTYGSLHSKRSTRIPSLARAGCCVIVLAVALCLIPQAAWSLSAQEILEEVVKHNFQDTFRIVLDVKTQKGKKTVSDHTLWLVGKVDKDASHFFIEFDAPKDSKGMRFLVQMKTGAEPEAFMYLPATGKTVPLAMDDPSADIGGTGLSMEDLQGFVPKGGETAEVVGDEKVDGRECYVLRVTLPSAVGNRMLWIAKDGFLVIKTQQLDGKGKLKRTFRVVEFFKTDQEREFPREEEITIPDKDARIRVRQEHAVFGIELPEEIMNPAKFGTYRWRD
jgi:hypothetical protein